MVSSDQIAALATDEGLDLAGAVPVGASPFYDAYLAWLEAGYAAEMGYLARPDAVVKREDPRRIMPEAKTVLVVAASYVGAPRLRLPLLRGRVSRYAWGPPPRAGSEAHIAALPGEDYHRWVLRRLKALVSRIEDLLGEPVRSRCYVDTGPVLERAWAQAAGLGWIGKNANLIHPRLGSYLFLGVALLDVALPFTAPATLPTCGTCTRCIEACPTGAIVAPHVIDARRCLSYLTIEHRGPIPEALRPHVGARVFGCDICQEVCPWNERPLAEHEEDAIPELATLRLPDLLRMDAEAFRARFRHTAIWRATPEGLARNAAVALGNLRDRADLPEGSAALSEAISALTDAAAHHPSALVREHAGWALTRLR